MYGVSALLDCHGDVDIEHTRPSPLLNATQEHTFTWNVMPVIDWWEVDKDILCDASLYAFVGAGNDESDDSSVALRESGQDFGRETVQSWSPDLSVAFIACVVAALLSFIFTDLCSQKMATWWCVRRRLAFGFAFHLFTVMYWGPAVLALCALWIWRMTWKSSDEFRLIHHDYQRLEKESPRFIPTTSSAQRQPPTTHHHPLHPGIGYAGHRAWIATSTVSR